LQHNAASRFQPGDYAFPINKEKSMPRHKDVRFVGSALKDLKEFPPDTRRAAGFQLDLLQQGDEPFDWRPMKTVGRGVNEIRITEDSGAFRVFYVVSRPEAIYVLHAMHKTTRKTETRDIELARARYQEIR
jgi:phage-related protein